MGSFLRYLANCNHNFKDVLVVRSQCDHCHKVLKRYELIPVFSWLIQKGKCNQCKSKLSTSYLISEIGTASFFMYLGSIFAGSTVAIQLLIALIGCCLTYIAMIDIIKKELSVISYTLSLLLFFGLYYLSHSVDKLDIGIIGMYWFGLRFIIWLIGILIHKVKYNTRGQGLGFGDVLFAGLLGLLFGLGIQHSTFQELYVSSNYSYFIFLTLALHMLASSVCGILGFLFLEDEKLAFIPYLLGGFVIMTILLSNYSDTILSLLPY